MNKPNKAPSKIRFYLDIIRETGIEWVDDNASRLGAALAFYSALSLVPLLLLSLSVLGLVYSAADAQSELVNQATAVMGAESAGIIRDILSAAATDPKTSLLATLIGVVTLLFGASGVFGQLQDALNEIWNIKPKAESGLWNIIKKRILSIALVLCTSFLLLASLIASAALTAISTYAAELLPSSSLYLEAGNFGFSFAMVTLLFATIFKFLPDFPAHARLPWRDVLPGAAITAFLFVIGKAAIAFYLGYSGLSSGYGAAGSLIAILVWVYYSAQILFLGAEFTQVYARRKSGALAADMQA